VTATLHVYFASILLLATYVAEFWKITHMGAHKIIRIFMVGGFLLRADHTFKNISKLF